MVGKTVTRRNGLWQELGYIADMRRKGAETFLPARTQGGLLLNFGKGLSVYKQIK